MRHQLKGRKFHRDMSAKKALFKSLALSLIEHELIKTTLPKGKDLRSVAEPLITLAKTDSVANRRLAFARLGNDGAVKKLFEVLGPRYKTRQGGYLRILKCGFRKGDAAPMCYVELVDREGLEEAVVAETTPAKALKAPAVKTPKAPAAEKAPAKIKAKPTKAAAPLKAKAETKAKAKAVPAKVKAEKAPAKAKKAPKA